jgi:glycosyltransferase involved in cell wall biosynthesis
LTICNSRFTESALENFAPSLRHEVMYYPVAPTESVFNEADLSNIRAELDAPPNSTVVIQVSRLEPWKGHELHLRALSKLRNLEDWVCWIVGGAQRPHEVQYLERLQAMAIDLGIGGRVSFLGQRTDVPRLLAAADVFCQPNIGPEPFGIVFIEALYAGLPVVTATFGGAAEIVDDSCGMRVAVDDEDDLADALCHLIRNPAQRLQLGLNGQSRARALCDPAKQLTNLAELIAQLAITRLLDH